jgi:phosphate uptake regulator
MDTNKHILGSFDDALDRLRNDVLVMASLAAKSLANALAGLLNQDEARCATAIADDVEIDHGAVSACRFRPEAGCFRDENWKQSRTHCRPGD